MRIALVLAGPFPDLRGSQVLVRHLADGVRGRGHDVHLVTYGAVRPPAPGPRVERQPTIRIDFAAAIRIVK